MKNYESTSVGWQCGCLCETKREVGVLPEGSCCVRLTAEAVEGEKET